MRTFWLTGRIGHLFQFDENSRDSDSIPDLFPRSAIARYRQTSQIGNKYNYKI